MNSTEVQLLIVFFFAYKLFIKICSNYVQLVFKLETPFPLHDIDFNNFKLISTFYSTTSMIRKNN